MAMFVLLARPAGAKLIAPHAGDHHAIWILQELDAVIDAWLPRDGKMDVMTNRAFQLFWKFLDVQSGFPRRGANPKFTKNIISHDVCYDGFQSVVGK